MWLYSTSIVLEIVELHIRYRQQTLQWWKRLTSNRGHTMVFHLFGFGGKISFGIIRSPYG
jgi:hypothetical protein